MGEQITDDVRGALSEIISQIDQGGKVFARDACIARARAALAARPAPTALEWRPGAPPKPWSMEWFIAETTYGDRVVLTALPDEWSYDFKTADDTHIMADRIKRWMQFPGSEFISPAPTVPEDVARLVSVPRSVAVDMLKEGIQWRLDPAYIIKLCDTLTAQAARIAELEQALSRGEDAPT